MFFFCINKKLGHLIEVNEDEFEFLILYYLFTGSPALILPIENLQPKIPYYINTRTFWKNGYIMIVNGFFAKSTAVRFPIGVVYPLGVVS